jgi:hypothetical protein
MVVKLPIKGWVLLKIDDEAIFSCIKWVLLSEKEIARKRWVLYKVLLKIFEF